MNIYSGASNRFLKAACREKIAEGLGQNPVVLRILQWISWMSGHQSGQILICQIDMIQTTGVKYQKSQNSYPYVPGEFDDPQCQKLHLGRGEPGQRKSLRQR